MRNINSKFIALFLAIILLISTPISILAQEVIVPDSVDEINQEVLDEGIKNDIYRKKVI